MDTLPSGRNFRPFFSIVTASLLVLVIGAITVVLCFTGNAYAALPLTALGLAIVTLFKWAMFWQSTPEERKVLSKNLEREPLFAFLKAWREVKDVPEATDTMHQQSRTLAPGWSDERSTTTSAGQE